MVNGALDCEQYRFPNFSELFATLAGGKTFTRLDIPYPLPDHSALFVHLLVARNFLSLTYYRLISNFCWIRSHPSMLQSILIKGYIDITVFLLV